ncbi:MAG: 2OG-Fe(II) oxygenase [Egibacteraceae bacterium]
MPAADLFARLGLFVRRGFLDPESCERLREHARTASKVPGAVGAEDAEYEVDVRSRSTDIAEVAPEAVALVSNRLDALTPEISLHFDVELGGRQSLQFLVYNEGDFFEPHRDRNETGAAAAFGSARRVSVVLFLNREAEQPSPGSYGGGALTFYGLMGGDPKVGLPLLGEQGLLVGFASDLVHGVTPVTHGERYTVVTWLVAAGG